MKKTLLPLCHVALVSSLFSAEPTTFLINPDDWADGEVPKEVFVVEGKVLIGPKDGNKAIIIDPGAELTEACAQLAVSAAGESSVEARVFATKRARSVPKFGVSVHGMSGYRLLVNAAKKQLELVKSDVVAASVPFPWTSDTWVKLSLSAKRGEGDAWTIEGKAWPQGAADAITVQTTDKGLKGQGKVGLWGTPYSQTPIYFDDIIVKNEVAAAAP